MWFNNALVYHYQLDKDINFAELLAEERLKPCPPHARFIQGWLPAYKDEFAQEVAGAALICLGKEEKILPRGVINKLLAEKIEAIETQQDRKLKRSERTQMAEELEFELLPKAFSIQKSLLALFDTAKKRLIINTASDTQASQLTALLRKSIPGLELEPLFYPESLALRFAQWITNPSTLPPTFALASDCLLFSLKDEKKRINCKGCEMPAEEILSLLSQGLVAAELSLIWNERIQFTLTQDLCFKRLKSLDYLIDEFNDISQLEEDYLQKDAALTLVCGELRSLVDALMEGLNQPQQVEAKETELKEERELKQEETPVPA